MAAANGVARLKFCRWAEKRLGASPAILVPILVAILSHCPTGLLTRIGTRITTRMDGLLPATISGQPRDHTKSNQLAVEEACQQRTRAAAALGTMLASRAGDRAPYRKRWRPVSDLTDFAGGPGTVAATRLDHRDHRRRTPAGDTVKLLAGRVGLRGWGRPLTGLRRGV
jgi:hypothetical protein